MKNRLQQEGAGKVLLRFLPALLMAALGVFTALTDPSFGVDEAYTMDFIKGSYGRLIGLCAADVHPPLYFILLKAWVDLGSLLTPLSATALAKIFSTLPLVILMVLGATLVRRWWGGGAALLFQLCFLAGDLTHYASVLRMYSWASLFVTLAALAACRVLGAGDSTRWGWPALALATLAAAYTHYFACVSVGCVYLFLMIGLLIQKKARAIPVLIGCGLIALVGYLPWLPSLVGQLTNVREDYWIEAVNFKTLLLCLGTPFASEKTPVALASGAVFALAFGLTLLWVLITWLAERRQNKPLQARDGFALMFLLVAPCTVLFGALASWLMRPVFVARYMVPCIPCLWLGFALFALRLPEKRQKALALLLCAVSVVSCGKVVHTEITQGSEYRRFMEFKDQVIGEELILDDEYHLRETLFFTHPQWNHEALEEDSRWDGTGRIWVIATDPEPAEKLAREAGLNEEECLEDYGPFQMCEEHFRIYSLTGPGSAD